MPAGWMQLASLALKCQAAAGQRAHRLCPCAQGWNPAIFCRGARARPRPSASWLPTSAWQWLHLPVPLALENIASRSSSGQTRRWTRRIFSTEVLDRITPGAWLLLDRCRKRVRQRAPQPRLRPRTVFWTASRWSGIAYVHIGGGVERNGIYHDTHVHTVKRQAGVLELLAGLVRHEGRLARA